MVSSKRDYYFSGRKITMGKKEDAKLISEKAKSYFGQGFN
jgi:hypothetical protein